MKLAITILIAALIILAALAVIVRRVARFIRTRGQSGCENCTWSGCSRCHRH